MQKWDSRDSGTESAGEDIWETTRQDDYKSAEGTGPRGRDRRGRCTRLRSERRALLRRRVGAHVYVTYRAGSGVLLDRTTKFFGSQIYTGGSIQATTMSVP